MLIVAYRQDRPTALAYGNRGKPSHRRKPRAVEEEIVELAKGQYHDPNNCHFTEELEERQETGWQLQLPEVGRNHSLFRVSRIVRNLRLRQGPSSGRGPSLLPALHRSTRPGPAPGQQSDFLLP
jgi:hypothetical protein